MENYIFDLLENITLESIIISLVIFFITTLLKYPIKKLTSKLNEERRKAINSIIIVIPILLSVTISSIYLAITNKTSDSFLYYDLIISSFIYSLSIYAVYQRILIIIKGIKNNELDTNQLLDTITNNSNQFNLKLKQDENKLLQTEKAITQLIEFKNTNSSSLNKIFETNIKIDELTKEKKQLENEINEIKNNLEK